MAQIRSFVKPHKLFRYRSLMNLDQEIEALTQNYLYCSSYLKLNDPMEGLYTSSAILRKSKAHQAVRTAILNDKRKIGICSLSETNDHALMWAHYAGQFTGICIEYSMHKILSNLPTDVDFVRMFYDEHGPTVSSSSKPTKVLAKTVLSQKNYRWQYEREWRMFAQQGKIFYGKPECVTHVYLGYRMKAPIKRRIKAVLDKHSIQSTSMSIKRYSIKFD